MTTGIRHLPQPDGFNVNPRSKVKAFFNRVSSEASDVKLINPIVKIVRGPLGILALASSKITQLAPYINPLEPLNGALGNFTDILKLFGIASSIKTLHEQATCKTHTTAEKVGRVFKMASATVSINSALLTVVKIGNNLKIISVAKQMGRFPILRTAYPLFPITSLSALLDLFVAGCEIGTSLAKMPGLHKRTKKEKAKIKLWSQDLRLIAKAEKAKIATKQARLVEDLKLAHDQLDQTIQSFESCKKAYDDHLSDLAIKKADIKSTALPYRPFKVIAHKIKGLGPSKARHQMKKAIIAHENAWNQHRSLLQKLNRNETKAESLTKIENASDGEDLSAFDAVKSKKLEKHRFKLWNGKFDIFKECLTIALASMLAIISIAAMILTPFLLFTGLWPVPFLISLSSAYLCLTVLGLGKHFLMKKEGKRADPVLFAAASA